MSKTKVLLNLDFGHKKMGFSGIPQDTRLLFDRLGVSENLDVAGILATNANAWHGDELNMFEAQADFIGNHLNAPQEHIGSRLLRKLNHNLGNAAERMWFGFKKKYGMYPLRRELTEMVWREFFASTIESSRKKSILEREFYITAMGMWRMSDAAYYKRPAATLDTRGYDFAIFQDARKVRLSGKTQKVIRYHDGIPVLAADTVRNSRYLKIHSRSVRACEKDSLFVCNSTSSVADLEILSAEAADKATVIPYFVPPMKPLETTRNQLRELAASRLSQSTLPSNASKTEQKMRLLETWFSAAKDANSIPQYLMTLSTIEPRKNIPALISAWQRLRETNPNLRLLIVGRPGWEFEKTLSSMRPFVEQGHLLHLEGIAQREMRYLYSAASCFVFPSFSEGFGLPPVEAMQCACPVVVSDIPAHRYMGGEAALFFDPYDITDIADRIAAALLPDKASQMREAGFKNAERFTIDSVLPQWEAFFDKHRK